MVLMGLDLALGFGLTNNGEGDSIFSQSGGICEFEFGVDLACCEFGEGFYFDEGGVSDL